MKNQLAKSSRAFSVVGVLDVAGGRAVHARRGERDRYVPVSHVAGIDIGEGSPVAVARAYVERLGVRTLYVADLDAIGGKPAQRDVIGRLKGTGASQIWVDAGAGSLEDGQRVIESGASGVVVGLETLPSFDILDRVVEGLGRDRVAFSLDLKKGIPIISRSMAGPTGPSEASADPVEVARRAVRSQVGTLIVIDLDRVGMSLGIERDLVEQIRVEAPDIRLFAGGGIQDPDDLVALARSGCNGALVATALHEGRIARNDIDFVEWHPESQKK